MTVLLHSNEWFVLFRNFTLMELVSQYIKVTLQTTQSVNFGDNKRIPMSVRWNKEQRNERLDPCFAPSFPSQKMNNYKTQYC